MVTMRQLTKAHKHSVIRKLFPGSISGEERQVYSDGVGPYLAEVLENIRSENTSHCSSMSPHSSPSPRRSAA